MPIDLKQLENRVFTPEEAAERIGIHADTVRRLCRTGAIRAAKPRGSKSYFINGRDLIQYIEGVDTPLDGLPTVDDVLDGLPEPDIEGMLGAFEQPALSFGGPSATNASTATARQPKKAANRAIGNGKGNRCHPADPLPATRCQPVADPLPSSRRGGR